MLSKSYRLTRERDFKKINSLGKPFFSSLLRIRILTTNKNNNRFAVVVSAKVSKKAVERNLLKRRLREVIRLNQSRFKSGFDVVVVANPLALNASYQDLESQLLKLFIKAKFL